jgi:deoxynucleoside triphosphate triphosphohydrolase SAMHD1
LDPLCIKIIDTVEFQRLHSLKQLGTCDFVFRNATHTRFEHSLGVSHLAGRLANVLRTNQPYLNLTDADILCVKVAGLCHDLGHGPFSHVFDGVFLKRMYPSEGDGHSGDSWRHEDGSVQMLRYILKENEISVSDYGLDDRDLLFIEEIISGTKEEDRKGRESKKFFLYGNLIFLLVPQNNLPLLLSSSLL